MSGRRCAGRLPRPERRARCCTCRWTRTLSKLADVEGALGGLTAENLGYCEQCESPIPAGLLQALPETRPARAAPPCPLQRNDTLRRGKQVTAAYPSAGCRSGGDAERRPRPQGRPRRTPPRPQDLPRSARGRAPAGPVIPGPSLVGGSSNRCKNCDRDGSLCNGDHGPYACAGSLGLRPHPGQPAVRSPPAGGRCGARGAAHRLPHRWHRADDREPPGVRRAEFVIYLLACVAVPAAAAWGWGERGRAGTAVLAVGFLIMPVMVIRVQQVWAGPVG